MGPPPPALAPADELFFVVHTRMMESEQELESIIKEDERQERDD